MRLLHGQQGLNALLGCRVIAKQRGHAQRGHSRKPATQQHLLPVTQLGESGCQTMWIASQLGRFEIGFAFAGTRQRKLQQGRHRAVQMPTPEAGRLTSWALKQCAERG